MSRNALLLLALLAVGTATHCARSYLRELQGGSHASACTGSRATEREQPLQALESVGASQSQRRSLQRDTDARVQGRIHLPASRWGHSQEAGGLGDSDLLAGLELIAVAARDRRQESSTSPRPDAWQLLDQLGIEALVEDRAGPKARSELLDSGLTWSRAVLAPDGQFEATLPRDASVTRLYLRSRWLYLDRAHEVDLESLAPIDLRPELGGRIAISISLADGLAVEELELRLGHGPYERELPIDASLVSESLALAPGSHYYARLRGERFPELNRENLEVRAGVVTRCAFAARQPCSLAGRVVDTSGQPVQGAHVLALAPHPRRQFESVGPRGGSSTTGSDGEFHLPAVDARTTRLLVEHAGFHPLVRELDALTPGERRGSLLLELAEGDRLSGRVLAPGGRPAAHAELTLWLADSETEAPCLRTLADEDGRFELQGLEPVSYVLHGEYRPAGESRTHFAGSATSHAAGRTPGSNAQRLPVELVLSERAPLTGRVVDPTGLAVNEFELLLRPTTPKSLRTERYPFRDPRGGFELSGLSDGGWMLTASSEGFLPARPLEVRLPASGTITIELTPAARVTGTVLDPEGLLIATAEVRARLGPTAKCNEQGRFELGPLRPGPNALVATADGFAPSKPVKLDITPESNAPITLQLAHAASLGGRVHTGHGLSARDYRVYLHTPYHGRLVTVPDDFGAFSFERLYPGEHQLVALPATGDDSAGSGPARIFTERVALAPGAHEEVELGRPARIHLWGRVEPAGSRRLAIVLSNDSRGAPLAATLTDEHGRFSLSLSSSGTHAVSVVDARSGREMHRTTVVVTEDPDQTLDIGLPSAAFEGTTGTTR